MVWRLFEKYPAPMGAALALGLVGLFLVIVAAL
jgi:hypothetical protein